MPIKKKLPKSRYTFKISTFLKHSILLFLICCSFFVNAQEKVAYKIFDKTGKEIKYSTLLSGMLKSEVVLFGEIHNNPIAHWLELQLLKDFYKLEKEVTVGMEMFEVDNQIILDEYLSGVIQEKNFTSEARIWTNYETDYKPIVNFCYENKIKLFGTNIPRRYANLVYRKGLPALDSLSVEARSYFVPLPFRIDLNLPGYKTLIGSESPHSGEINDNLALSQAIKDATMAYFIIKNLKKKYLHFNGSYHSHNFEGIAWYLKEYKKNVSVFTIETIEQKNIEVLETVNKMGADVIIVIPEDMTKTY